jgi:hypothetical protein
MQHDPAAPNGMIAKTAEALGARASRRGSSTQASSEHSGSG